VDAHGFTHFAMAMAKLLGFDLVSPLGQGWVGGKGQSPGSTSPWPASGRHSVRGNRCQFASRSMTRSSSARMRDSRRRSR
jgi:hypothetical protein